MESPIRIGITMGDPSGIGAEIIAKSVSNPEINKLGEIFIIGDKWVLNKVKSQKLKVKSEKSKVKILDLDNVSHKNFAFGRIKAEYGKASVEYLNKAVELVKNKEIDCLVTAPISKKAINLAGYKYNGHTEFLARAFGKREKEIVMLLLNKYIRIGLVTRHLALKRAISVLKQESIFNTITITYKALKEYFAIGRPNICVAALNPHAGEGGLLGREEIEQIAPAVKRFRRGIKGIFGPLPADSAFSAAKHGQVDAVIAMYHDQALIPLKVTDPDSGVNLTLGLDIVRTSPLHGTGFDIAGRNMASNSSLISAIKTAVGCSINFRKIKGICPRMGK
ncbi:MAG: 4-hydroxythreonine-4-phosphate dehydrogenase PdxA [Candidatus Omnitrophota bacterium]